MFALSRKMSAILAATALAVGAAGCGDEGEEEEGVGGAAEEEVIEEEE